MELLVAARVGFCAGVRRALEMVENLLKAGKKVCLLGEIVHNQEVMKQLKKRGVRVVFSPDEVAEDETLVLSAHGSPAGLCQELKQRGIEFVDSTCVFVKKVHGIVQAQDSVVIIVGDANHCEVKAIKSRCSKGGFVVKDEFELESLLAGEKNLKKEKICVVEQTTFFAQELPCLKRKVEAGCTNAAFFDTICKETKLRQDEARAIAQKCDLVLVVGSKNSSNNSKLLQICSGITKAVLVESILELKNLDFKGAKRVGLVAGASTPISLFMGVRELMENIGDEIFDFEKELNDSFRKLKVGEQIKGIVTRVSPSEIQLDINFKYTGYISAEEYSDLDVKLTDEVKCGDEIETVVVKIHDTDGSAELSRKRFLNRGAFDEVKEALASSQLLSGKVAKVLDAGVILNYKGVKVFVHNLQLGLPSGTDPSSLLGKTVEFKVFSVDERRRSAKGSIKAAAAEKRAQLASQAWDTLEVGKRYLGTVKSITGFGIFVEVCGIDGLVHISDISWDRIKAPSEFCSVGDEIEVTVKDMDRENNRLSLSCKKEEEDPWLLFCNQFKVGDIVDAQVTSVRPFGVFAKIIPGVNGLIHVSQLSKDYVQDPAKLFKVGDSVRVKILHIDEDEKRIQLSVKALEEDEEELEQPEQV